MTFVVVYLYEFLLFFKKLGSERGMLEAADESFRSGAAESGAERFVSAEDKASFRPPSSGKRHSFITTSKNVGFF